MIESSIIKLILIVVLNMCFVRVWVKKERLRSFMPFEIIRKLEKISFLKNYKKTKGIISFIGSINMFWVLNISYLVLIKFFEKELNLILGFPEGMTRDAISQTNVLKSNYIYANSLDEITKFIFDTGNMPTLFVGVTALMIPIYLYIIGFKSKSKRQLLLMLTKKGDMFYISFFIYIMLFFKVEKIFLIGAIGYLIYLLMEAVKWIMKIENSLYSFEGLDKILKLQEEEEIVELYNATLNELYQGVKDSNISLTHENKELLVKMLRNDELEVKVDSRKLLKSLYDIYDVAIKNQDDDIFRKISHIHVHIAQYYLRNQDDENFYQALGEMGKVYDYYHIDGTDKFELDVFSGFRHDYFGIYEQYKENFEEGKLWYSQMFKAITEGIKKAVENEDFYFFQQFIYLIGHQFKDKDNLKRDYKLLERSVYFGILMYLKEEKRKLENNEDRLKKLDVYIELIEKLLSNNNIIELIELYGVSEEYSDRLNWDKFFQTKIGLGKRRIRAVRTDVEKDNLFFELLGKIGDFQSYKNILLKDECLKRYLKNKNVKDVKKLIERINKFKGNVGYLLGIFQNYKENTTIEEKNCNEIENLLKELAGKNKQERDESIREAKVSKSKIELTKTILIDIMKKSSVIKMLEGFNKYKLSFEEKNEKIQGLGINEYMEKEFFTEIGDEDRIKARAESYGKEQNRGIEQIIIESIEAKKEEINSIEEALEKIKGKPWIILTGIPMFSFFYNESGKDRKNIVLSSDLGKEYFEKYGEILEGIYKYKGTEIPIYNFSSDRKGIYILDSDDIEGFIHYDAKEEDENSKNIEKRFDKTVGYSHLTIIETEKIIKSGEIDKVLKSGILKDYKTEDEKLNQFKQLVWITFVQKGELKLKEDAKVYRVEFNG